ncbi:MAG: tRNA (adenosine(37)-N6)-threonylcarbamoyltransferase complex transferase subunit TsaD [Hyphomicrobiaceae bacterium]|nr:tRNA (adenosine(37)-N6)-threonylcarbamoyltransferase complex transferase subunit TsaD [Hyphomicrobiaceae bacterium]
MDVRGSPSASAIVLGIETSCDETAAAVIRRHADARGEILSNVVRSQWEAHRPYGGVVPEIAARAHVACIDAIVANAMRDANVDWTELDAVAVTAGPGLVGGLIVGLTTAKAIALVHGLPLVAVNHLEAHALTAGLTDGLRPPYLLLLVSGGHTQLVDVTEVGHYVRLGTTIDDALGEAFDKTAKLLGLGFPGGPAVETAAREGSPGRFSLPRPLAGRPEPNFSFAGLKTAVRLAASKVAPLSARDVADICADFQETVAAIASDRLRRAMTIVEQRRGPRKDGRHALVVAGGVAANLRLRAAIAEVTGLAGWRLVIPPPALCTDNAVMVAWAGAEQLARGRTDGLDTAARARWPLDDTAQPLLGAGRHGAKA